MLCQQIGVLALFNNNSSFSSHPKLSEGTEKSVLTNKYLTHTSILIAYMFAVVLIRHFKQCYNVIFVHVLFLNYLIYYKLNMYSVDSYEKRLKNKHRYFLVYALI